MIDITFNFDEYNNSRVDFFIQKCDVLCTVSCAHIQLLLELICETFRIH